MFVVVFILNFKIDWFELHYKGKPAGEIYLEMTFYAAVSARSTFDRKDNFLFIKLVT